VNRSDEFVRFRSDDRERFNLSAIRLAPHVPKPSESKRLAVPEMNPHRDFPLSLFPPLVKTVRRDDAPATTHSVFETRFFGQCFRTGVDHPVSDTRVFGSVRNQAPVHEPALVAAVVADNDGNRRGNLFGGNVKARRVQRDYDT
jgi:hypothetical protein